MIKDPKTLEIESTLVDLLIIILSVKNFLQKKNFVVFVYLLMLNDNNIERLSVKLSDTTH